MPLDWFTGTLSIDSLYPKGICTVDDLLYISILAKYAYLRGKRLSLSMYLTEGLRTSCALGIKDAFNYWVSKGVIILPGGTEGTSVTPYNLSSGFVDSLVLRYDDEALLRAAVNNPLGVSFELYPVDFTVADASFEKPYYCDMSTDLVNAFKTGGGWVFYAPDHPSFSDKKQGFRGFCDLLLSLGGAVLNPTEGLTEVEGALAFTSIDEHHGVNCGIGEWRLLDLIAYVQIEGLLGHNRLLCVVLDAYIVQACLVSDFLEYMYHSPANNGGWIGFKYALPFIREGSELYYDLDSTMEKRVLDTALSYDEVSCHHGGGLLDHKAKDYLAFTSISEADKIRAEVVSWWHELEKNNFVTHLQWGGGRDGVKIQCSDLESKADYLQKSAMPRFKHAVSRSWYRECMQATEGDIFLLYQFSPVATAGNYVTSKTRLPVDVKLVEYLGMEGSDVHLRKLPPETVENSICNFFTIFSTVITQMKADYQSQTHKRYRGGLISLSGALNFNICSPSKMYSKISIPLEELGLNYMTTTEPCALLPLQLCEKYTVYAYEGIKKAADGSTLYAFLEIQMPEDEAIYWIVKGNINIAMLDLMHKQGVSVPAAVSDRGEVPQFNTRAYVKRYAKDTEGHQMLYDRLMQANKVSDAVTIAGKIMVYPIVKDAGRYLHQRGCKTKELLIPDGVMRTLFNVKQ